MIADPFASRHDLFGKYQATERERHLIKTGTGSTANRDDRLHGTGITPWNAISVKEDKQGKRVRIDFSEGIRQSTSR